MLPLSKSTVFVLASCLINMLTISKVNLIKTNQVFISAFNKFLQ